MPISNETLLYLSLILMGLGLVSRGILLYLVVTKSHRFRGCTGPPGKDGLTKEEIESAISQASAMLLGVLSRQIDLELKEIQSKIKDGKNGA